MTPEQPYYRQDLATIHDRAFGFHAERVAPGVLALLEPVRTRGGLVVEVGAGSGALTRRLVEAGHRVVATDASPAMLALLERVPGTEGTGLLALPDDPIPACDALVGVGHPLNYLSDEASLHRALDAAAAALRPGGLLVVDVCDLSYGEDRTSPVFARVEDDLAIVTRFSLPARERFVRDITTFLRTPDGTWRRDDERHETVLVEVSRLPGVLAAAGVHAVVRTGFGDETLPPGLVAVVGTKS